VLKILEMFNFKTSVEYFRQLDEYLISPAGPSRRKVSSK